MEKGLLIYEGKGKLIYEFKGDNEKVIARFKDTMTAFDGKKKEDFAKKGEYSARLTSIFFERLGQKGVGTHYIEYLGGSEVLFKRLDMIGLELVVRNIVAGSLVKRTGLREGLALERGLIEYYYKNDDLGDPLLNEQHIELCRLASAKEIQSMEQIAREVNDCLKELLDRVGVLLVDFKIELGLFKGELMLGDEITPDTCRFWDKKSWDILDKDRFRKGLGCELSGYEEILRRLG